MLINIMVSHDVRTHLIIPDSQVASGIICRPRASREGTTSNVEIILAIASHRLLSAKSFPGHTLNMVNT